MKASFIGLIVLVAIVAAGCNRTRPQKWTRGEIEIAPDQFVEVDYLSMGKGARGDASFKEMWKCGSNFELFELRLHWKGTNLHWRHCGWPIVFRLFEDKFYGISFERCSLSKPKGPIIARFHYFAQSGHSLQEIPATSFPKQIAIQNVMLDADEFSCGDEKRTELGLARTADPNDICFQRTLTAAIWNELTAGQTYDETERFGASTNLLKGFARTNDLIRLQTIIKHPQRSGPAQRPVTEWEWLRKHL
jgi:hypothetical protein